MSRFRKQKNQRIYVSLEKWRQFERFLDVVSNIEEAVQELDQTWSAHLDFLTNELRYDGSEFEEVSDTLQRVTDLIGMTIDPNFVEGTKLEPSYRKYEEDDWQYSKSPPPRGYKVVEVILEDISTGDEF